MEAGVRWGSLCQLGAISASAARDKEAFFLVKGLGEEHMRSAV